MDRIIPARAGFTPCASDWPGHRADHPRTRGVYWIGTQSGLPSLWIIPARAGFTRNDIYERFGKPDHPRTRGVY